ncbi:MAG: glycosyltransferase [Paludibacteraceae bacterium]|nr:glycosyltransferase [Paludibacteraceae bacterium]
MSKRILILCDAFNKPLYVPRITSLCKFLTRNGWDITILTERLEDETFQVPNTVFLAMPYYFGTKWQKRLQWLGDKLWYRKDICLYKFAKQHLDLRHFDCILCSSFNVFPLKTASMITTRFKKPLLVDLRDITEQWGTTSYMLNSISNQGRIGSFLTNLYIRKTTRQRNGILRQAKLVTTVSNWHQNILKQYNSQTHLIYNGYDPDTYVFKPITTNQFIISYIGRIYDFRSRNPHIFLQAIKQLKSTKNTIVNDIKIIFHIENDLIAPLSALVQKYEIQDLCSISGYIPRQEAIDLLQKSAISLIFNETTDSTNMHGIMTTKFFEALGCEKPILCTPSETEELAETIRQTNAGLASSDIQEIKDFILNKYREWQQQGYTRQAVINKEQFSREKQAQQFEQLFREVRTLRC